MSRMPTASAALWAALWASPASAASVSLTWSPSTDVVGVTGYKVYRNGSFLSNASCCSYIDSTAAASTQYTYTVTAFDAASNESSASGPYVVLTRADGSYSTQFRATEYPIAELGHWTNGSAASAQWGNVRINGTMAYGASIPAQFGDPTAVLTSTYTAWAATQSAAGTVKITSAPAATVEAGIRLRTTISTNSITGYKVYCSTNAADKYCHIARWHGPIGSWCNFEVSTPAVNLVDGDVLMATVSGTTTTTIRGYVNGTLVFQATDAGSASTPTCSNYPGGQSAFTNGTPGNRVLDRAGERRGADQGGF